MVNTVLEVQNITKRFPGVIANDSISFKLNKGEIHALLGENGAGKSTLMNIIYGLYKPDEGQIFINEEAVEVQNPHDAIARGIGMVHQHFMLVPVFTVLENIVLGSETTNGPSLNLRSPRKDIQKIIDQFNLDIDLDTITEDLPVGIQQRVEIIKALYRQVDILVLDEPTAVLTPQEVDDLFKIMRSLVDQGKSIIFITHKLKEVIEIADQITVIRRGKVVGSAKPDEADQQSLATMMVGRDVDMHLHKKKAEPKEMILEVNNLVVKDANGNVEVDDVSFEIKAGEIVGIAGVQGNGQTELVNALVGMIPTESGTVKINGLPATNASPRKVTEMGSAHIPEDRLKDGLVLPFTIADNMVLNTYYLEPFAKSGIRQQEEIKEFAVDLVEKFDVRTPSAENTASSLSGGNQQKVIVAREFSRPINLLIAAQPTRGLDVGSIEYIHHRIIEKRDEGCAVMVVSTELDEIMELSDRIIVMFNGKIIDTVNADEITKEQIGLLMAGVTA
jgi:simple sugar transport system ATP-binding protein